MQNRYAGDVGDYSKLGLIRAFERMGLAVGLVWCLADDESHNRDGKHIDYLTEPRKREAFRACDPDLFDALAGFIRRGQRTVKALEALNIWRTQRFFSERLSYRDVSTKQRIEYRRGWFDYAARAMTGVDVVFFDPDNGLKNPATKLTRKAGCKFVAADELRSFWQAGQSLVVYQHLSRNGSAEQQAAQRLAQLGDGLGAKSVDVLRYRRGTSRLYLCASQPKHRSRINAACAGLLSCWGGAFERCKGEKR